MVKLLKNCVFGDFGNAIFSKRADINTSIAEYQTCENAVLIDVREVNEYSTGHIPGAVNIPLSQIGSVENVVSDKDVSLYVYCLSGARSSKAVRGLQKMGYKKVKNIGGINSYKDPVEK